MTLSIRFLKRPLLAIIVYDWLALYYAAGLIEIILTGVTFIFDVLIYGIIIVITEGLSFYQLVYIILVIVRLDI